MKHVIIGTAGHIDHGKTMLIKALTGRETDNLKEEKERGISINLGFTFFDLPSGRRAGIIDVPGHEKFIKNMLAGAFGIDLVLVVVAADEGIMPQTREHIQILKFLGIKKGIIVLTKIDMVDDDWVEMIKEQIMEEIKGCFLENSPICSVSSTTGEGISNLISIIDNMTETVCSKDITGHFRLPVDRVFSVNGFGTVVTGTILSGKIKDGDSVEIYPSKLITKIRGIQVHDVKVEEAEAGQRCALNLSGIKRNEVSRGNIISQKGLMEPSLMVDCKLNYLGILGRPLQNRQRIRLHHGASEILCRVIILDKRELKPGEEAYVQLRLESPITAQREDKFVIRSYSPMHTIGGGIIIEPNAVKAKPFKDEYISELKLKESGKVYNILEKVIEKLSNSYPEKNDILRALGKNEYNLDKEILKLKQKDVIIELGNRDRLIYIHKNFFNNKVEELIRSLENFHGNNPLKFGMDKEEIKNKIFEKNLKQKIYDEIMVLIKEKKYINIKDNKYVSLHNFRISYNKEQERIVNNIIDIYRKYNFNPPKYDVLLKSEVDKNNFAAVYNSLVDRETLIKVSEDSTFLNENVVKAKEEIVDFIKKNGSISVGQCRDLLDTSRKHAVSLLEYLDIKKITIRIDNKRVLSHG